MQVTRRSRNVWRGCHIHRSRGGAKTGSVLRPRTYRVGAARPQVAQLAARLRTLRVGATAITSERQAEWAGTTASNDRHVSKAHRACQQELPPARSCHLTLGIRLAAGALGPGCNNRASVVLDLTQHSPKLDPAATNARPSDDYSGSSCSSNCFRTEPASVYLVHEQPLIRHPGGQGGSSARTHLELVQQHGRAAVVCRRPPG